MICQCPHAHVCEVGIDGCLDLGSNVDGGLKRFLGAELIVAVKELFKTVDGSTSGLVAKSRASSVNNAQRWYLEGLGVDPGKGPIESCCR